MLPDVLLVPLHPGLQVEPLYTGENRLRVMASAILGFLTKLVRFLWPPLNLRFALGPQRVESVEATHVQLVSVRGWSRIEFASPRVVARKPFESAGR